MRTHAHANHSLQKLAASIFIEGGMEKKKEKKKASARGFLLIACTFPSSSGSIKARPPSPFQVCCSPHSHVCCSSLPTIRQHISPPFICGVPHQKYPDTVSDLINVMHHEEKVHYTISVLWFQFTPRVYAFSTHIQREIKLISNVTCK